MGVNRVQQAKQQTLKSQSINLFTTKLTSIINKAESLGLTYEDWTLVRKLLNVVPDKFLQIVASIEKYLTIDTMSLDEGIGRLKTFEEILNYKKARSVNIQERLMFTQHEDRGQSFRGHGHGRFNQSRG